MAQKIKDNNGWEFINQSDKNYQNECQDHQKSVKGVALETPAVTTIDSKSVTTNNIPVPAMGTLGANTNSYARGGAISPIYKAIKRCNPSGDGSTIVIPANPTALELQVARALLGALAINGRDTDGNVTNRFSDSRVPLWLIAKVCKQYIATGNTDIIPGKDDITTIDAKLVFTAEVVEGASISGCGIVKTATTATLKLELPDGVTVTSIKWAKNGTDISGATTDSITIDGTDLTVTDKYECIVTYTAPAPVETVKIMKGMGDDFTVNGTAADASGVTVNVGEAATLAAVNTAGTTYTWIVDGVTLTETTATVTYTPTTTTDVSVSLTVA